MFEKLLIHSDGIREIRSTRIRGRSLLDTGDSFLNCLLYNNSVSKFPWFKLMLCSCIRLSNVITRNARDAHVMI